MPTSKHAARLRALGFRPEKEVIGKKEKGARKRAKKNGSAEPNPSEWFGPWFLKIVDITVLRDEEKNVWIKKARIDYATVLILEGLGFKNLSPNLPL